MFRNGRSPARSRGARQIGLRWLRGSSVLGLGALVALSAAALFPAHSSAAIGCTTAELVSAIATANSTSGGGTVTLASNCTYTLTGANNSTDGGTGLPVITGKVSVIGNGATITRSTSSGTPTFRFFDVAKSGTLTISNLALSNGALASNDSHGGGAIDNHGTLSVSALTFSNNSSPSPSGTSGGAIQNDGRATVDTSTFIGNLAMEGGAFFNQNTMTVSNSTFLNGKATIYGGGAFVNAYGTTTVTGSTFVGNTGPGGGAIDNDTTVVVRNSTFYKNTGGGNGGGAVQNFGTITISQSTLSGNTSQYGANIHNYGSSVVKIDSSIVANGVSGANCDGTPINDMGYNLDTGSSCGFSTGNHSINNTQPQLGALASNGGPTQTMALPLQSPAVDVVPSTFNGCTSGKDQRGVTRPQGARCDIGAYEVVQSSGDTQPPSVPANLTAPSVKSNSVSLQWNASTDNVGVTGYTVYRNGSVIGSTGGPTVTNYVDSTASPSTIYSYTVDAFDGANNHSAQSSALKVTTPAPSGIQGVQGSSVASASKVTSTTLPLTSTVFAGDLLVGWFAQFDSPGQVQVSDNLNGAWTRGPSTTFSSGTGDIAMYYVQNSAASTYGVTVTISASNATFLQGAASEYSGIAKAGALDQTAVARGLSTAVDSGATGAVGSGELVVGGVITGGSPGATTPGSSQGQAFTMRTQTASGSAALEDVLSSVAGTQDANATLTTSTDWYALAAVFRPFGSGDTQPPNTPTGLAAGTATASSVPLTWNASTDNVGVAGYTVYRGGTAIGTATSTAYTDTTVAPSSTYSYAVDAFDAAGNHSSKSTAITVTTPAAPPPTAHWVQGAAAGTGSKVTSTTLALPSAVGAGDLLAGWFAQYDSSGHVQVTDNVNGPWTRSSAATTFGSASGDIALFYVQNAAAAPSGLTITISATNATYLQGSASDFSGIAATNSLDATSIAKGNSASADTGMTAPVSAGEFALSGFMTGGGPGTVSVGNGLTLRDHNGSYGVDDASGPVTANGGVHAVWTLQNATDWYTMVAVFRASSGTSTPPDMQPPSTPAGLKATAVSPQSVSISWNASTDNVGVTGYTVYRNGTSLGTTGGSTTSYTDSTVAPSTTYSYTVDAFDAAGNHSPQSAALSVSTPAAPDAQPPSTPTGLTQGTVTANSASFSWTASTDNVGVTGYTVYRNGVSLGTTNATTTSYTDATVAPSTTYSYTVDAFDAAGNHSPQSAALSITTPAGSSPPPPAAKWVQGAAGGTGTKVTAYTFTLSAAVTAGDLLVGWFGQYDSPGQVTVSDNVNGAWTRSPAVTAFGSKGDIALYYLQNSKAAPSGLTVTISASAATYLQGSVSDYSGMATTNSLVTTSVASGNSAAADTGATGAAAAGEMLISGFMTGTSPGTVTAVSPLVMRDHNASYGEDDGNFMITTAGAQHAQWTLQTSADWYTAAAVFHTAAGP